MRCLIERGGTWKANWLIGGRANSFQASRRVGLPLGGSVGPAEQLIRAASRAGARMHLLCWRLASGRHKSRAGRLLWRWQQCNENERNSATGEPKPSRCDFAHKLKCGAANAAAD